MSIIKLKAKQSFIKVGEIQKNIGYIHSGLMRAFYIDEKGNEVTVNFIDEKKYVVEYDGLRKNKPSKLFFQCIEPTTLVLISKEHLENSIDNYAGIDRYLRLILEEFYSYMMSRFESILFENAETRYLNFINTNSTLFNRVSLSHLCSYLGVGSQTLTRIRQKVSKRLN